MANNTFSSYINYLPAIYQDPDFIGQENFLGEFLKIFEKLLSGRDDPLSEQDFESLRAIRGIEQILDDIHDHFDLLYAPEEFIRWLSGWIAFINNEDWPEEKRRRLRAEIISLYRVRGTLDSLVRYLEIYTTPSESATVEISEVASLIIGDGVEAPLLQVGLNTRVGSTYPYYFEVDIIIPNPADFISPDFDFKEREVLAIIDQEKPAYTYYDLRLQVGAMQISTSPELRGVHFFNTGLGWLVGASGVILRSEDGGLTLQEQVSGTSGHLYALSFVDESAGWVVGDGGQILHTTDGGESWIPQASGVEQGLRALHFSETDPANGWAAGEEGIILHTADSGLVWELQPSGITETLEALSFATALRGWAVGEAGTILRTTNGGSLWTDQSGATSEDLSGVHFENSNIGWAVGNNGTILATTNGGSDWNSQVSSVTQHLHEVFFLDASNGWAVGDGGIILRTIDGGNNWETVETVEIEVLVNFYDVVFEDANRGWIAGQRGMLLSTADGGASWSVTHSPKLQGHSTIGQDTLLGTLN